MISTEGGAEDRRKAWLSGANMYRVKPVEPEWLAGLFICLLGNSRKDTQHG